MEARKSSDRTSKRRDQRRSSAPPSGAGPDPGDSDGLAGALAYVKQFPRPELGKHPRHDGYNAGRALAQAYPEMMQKVMQGFREGVKDGTETVSRPEGRNDG